MGVVGPESFTLLLLQLLQERSGWRLRGRLLRQGLLLRSNRRCWLQGLRRRLKRADPRLALGIPLAVRLRELPRL